MSIGVNIAKLRQGQNLTQKELAEKVGISVSYLGKIEEEKSPRVKVHAKTLSRIAVALNATINELQE